MPLHHPKHRHHDDDLPSYRRSDDEAKPRRPYTPTVAASSSPASNRRLLLFFSGACRLVAAASLAFAVSSRRRPPPAQPPPVAFRCGRAEDSLRSFLAPASPPHRNYTAGDREKVLAIVGVHTELGSAACRAALRAKWLPQSCPGSSISDAYILLDCLISVAAAPAMLMLAASGCLCVSGMTLLVACRLGGRHHFSSTSFW
jgi:hypothetical protein